MSDQTVRGNEPAEPREPGPLLSQYKRPLSEVRVDLGSATAADVAPLRWDDAHMTFAEAECPWNDVRQSAPKGRP